LSDRGVNTLIGPLIIVFSGSLIPLPLFPAWMQRGLALQPLAGLIDIPMRIYSGSLAGVPAALGLVRQAAWIVVLAVVGRALMARVMARLQAQGG
jgi:ABC-2 type transport system permease protein